MTALYYIRIARKSFEPQLFCSLTALLFILMDVLKELLEFQKAILCRIKFQDLSDKINPFEISSKQIKINPEICLKMSL